MCRTTIYSTPPFFFLSKMWLWFQLHTFNINLNIIFIFLKEFPYFIFWTLTFINNDKWPSQNDRWCSNGFYYQTLINKSNFFRTHLYYTRNLLSMPGECWTSIYKQSSFLKINCSSCIFIFFNIKWSPSAIV